MKELEERKKISDRYKNTVEDIERSIESLPTEYFAYDKETRRFKMMRDIEFDKGKDSLKNPNDREYIVAIGRSIQKVISSLQAKNYENVRYVVIIEGMSSKDRAGEDVNYPLSYRRAWRVKRIWDADAISFDKDIVDVQISGSGTGGIGRKINEIENRQILIHIVPKIGRIGER
jgi:outer membrane protein OmpA-like peptidoglycan-associated protein